MVTQQKIREKTNKGLGEKSFFSCEKMKAHVESKLCTSLSLNCFKGKKLKKKKYFYPGSACTIYHFPLNLIEEEDINMVISL